MRILIATDAWHPQVNGVLSTLMAMTQALASIGETVRFLSPEGMPTVGLPSYRDIRLGLPRPGEIAERIAAISPDAIHIATEGSIGHLVRRYCIRRGRPFTTSFHTRFADYISARWPIPEEFSWTWLRWFHNGGRATMASTPSLMNELKHRGFRKVLRWPRGVDAELFNPSRRQTSHLSRPIFLSVGRVAVEKNLEAFLDLDLPGTKIVVGDGPARRDLSIRYPTAMFMGERYGEELAALYASADVFVFPSRTDTFGLVLLEALSCGTPIAGFPVPATQDVIGRAPVAVLDDDLAAACRGALQLSRAACRDHASTMTWKESARCFVGNLVAAGVCDRG